MLSPLSDKATLSLRRLAQLLVLALLPAFAQAHLSHAELMSLKPVPNVKEHGIGIFVYDGMNAMDALGPMQVFSAAGLQPFLVAKTAGIVTASNGLSINVAKGFADVNRLDILVVPGGAAETVLQTQDPVVLNWIKMIDQNTIYTTSVCTGAWILGTAELLRGKQATSNWYRAAEILKKFRAIPRPNQRYVFDGKLITSAGVTAGLDMALAIVQKLFSHDTTNGQDFTQAVMLDLQYSPKPPVRGGTLAKSDPSVAAAMTEMYDMYFYSDYPGYDWVKTLPYLPK
jgi:transcriptional regulator GlxA family with amidase domain